MSAKHLLLRCEDGAELLARTRAPVLVARVLEDNGILELQWLAGHETLSPEDRAKHERALLRFYHHEKGTPWGRIDPARN